MCLDNFHDVEEKASTEENSSRFSLQVPFPIDGRWHIFGLCGRVLWLSVLP